MLDITQYVDPCVRASIESLHWSKPYEVHTTMYDAGVLYTEGQRLYVTPEGVFTNQAELDGVRFVGRVLRAPVVALDPALYFTIELDPPPAVFGTTD